jgi:hypothetical protein
MSRLGVAATAAGISLALVASGALAQSAQPYVARAKVSVENNSPVPQTVAGTNVAPFQLLPHQQADLNMSIVPPPAPTAPGSTVPVQFEYSIGLAPGPQCHGAIDMSLHTRGAADGSYEVTDCVGHSLGTDGASCQIEMSAQTAHCQGALAFSAQ